MTPGKTALRAWVDGFLDGTPLLPLPAVGPEESRSSRPTRAAVLGLPDYLVTFTAVRVPLATT